MEFEQIKCPDCNEAYSRLSRWRFCPFCGNRPAGNVQTPYSVNEIAALTGWSRATVIRLFEDVPGVIVLSRPEEMHKRTYNSLRVPRHIYERVLEGLKVKAGRRTNASNKMVRV